MREINIEGYSPDEILGLPDEQLDALVLSGERFCFALGLRKSLGSSKSKVRV